MTPGIQCTPGNAAHAISRRRFLLLPCLPAWAFECTRWPYRRNPSLNGSGVHGLIG